MAQKQPEKYIGETEKNISRLQEGELDEWITTAEAAQISGYHPEHIRRLIRADNIKAKKFGIVWQVETESLLAYLKRVDSQGEKRGPKP